MTRNNATQASPKISIIVPVYNVEKYLRRCLDSIAAQTFTDWECICIDDGSPDNSGKILDEYAEKDSRFAVIHQANGGVSAARNAGLDATRGEWIAFVDSDDWVEKEMLLKLISTDGSDSAELIVCGTQDTLNLNTFLVSKNLEGNNTFNVLFSSVWAKLYRRKIIEENKLHFPIGIKLGEDTFFTYSYLANINLICYVDGNFYHYFVSNLESACHNLSYEAILGFEKTVKNLERYIFSKNRLNDFEQCLYNLKLDVKNRLLFSLTKPDFNQWRITFSEINEEILLKEKKFLQLHFYIIILNKWDFLADKALWLHKKIMKILRGI